jgi:hypothetical protein
VRGADKVPIDTQTTGVSFESVQGTRKHNCVASFAHRLRQRFSTTEPTCLRPITIIALRKVFGFCKECWADIYWRVRVLCSFRSKALESVNLPTSAQVVLEKKRLRVGQNTFCY